MITIWSSLVHFIADYINIAMHSSQQGWDLAILANSALLRAWNGGVGRNWRDWNSSVSNLAKPACPAQIEVSLNRYSILLPAPQAYQLKKKLTSFQEIIGYCSTYVFVLLVSSLPLINFFKKLVPFFIVAFSNFFRFFSCAPSLGIYLDSY